MWNGAVGASRELLRSAVAKVATLREQRMLEVGNDRGEFFRVWLWPLSEPDIAVCALVMVIPSELSLLTERERACLRCLAQGMSTKHPADPFTSPYYHRRTNHPFCYGKENLFYPSHSLLRLFFHRLHQHPHRCPHRKTIRISSSRRNFCLSQSRKKICR